MNDVIVRILASVATLGLSLPVFAQTQTESTAADAEATSNNESAPNSSSQNKQAVSPSKSAETVTQPEEPQNSAAASTHNRIEEPFVTADPTGPVPTGSGKLITLEEAHQRALSTYPMFQNIDEMIYQADMGIYKAWTLLMPVLTASASITLNQREVAIQIPLGENMPPKEMVIQDQWSKTSGFTANLTLFNPESIQLIKMAYDSYEKERLSAQIKRNDLLFAVTSAYYQAYAMNEMIRVAEENVAMANEFLRQATILKDAGQGTRIDVNRATIQLMSAEKELENTKSSQQQAILALKQLIDEDGPIELQGPKPVSPVDKPVESLKSEAVNSRVELKEAAIDATIAERSRLHTLSKYLPVFNLTYDWSWASAGGFSGSNVNWMLIFGAKWNIFLGGSRAVDYKVNQSQIRMTKHNITQITMDIEREVEKHHLDVQQRKIQLAILDKQVDLAKENHALVTKQFQAGLVTSLDVTNAATELASKKILKVYERLLFDLDVLKLRKSIGEYSSLSIIPAG